MLDVRGDGRPHAFGIRCEGAPGEAFGLNLRGIEGQCFWWPRTGSDADPFGAPRPLSLGPEAHTCKEQEEQAVSEAPGSRGMSENLTDVVLGKLLHETVE